MRTLILGCGYLGVALGGELVRRGAEVWGVRRSIAGDAALLQAGIRPVHADVTQPGWSAGLPTDWDAVVYCAAPGAGTPGDYRAVYEAGVRGAIADLGRLRVRRVLYTSSTSVYTAADGEWVTEESPAEPLDEKGRLLRAAELMWTAAAGTVCETVLVLRISGMYGWGRGYYLRRFLEGPELDAGEAQRWVNQVHRDDVVSAAVLALERAPSTRTYNVADDEPARLGEIFAWLTERLGRCAGSGHPVGTLPRRRRGAGDKRVSNARLKAELGWQPRYPTYREGYEAELRRMGLWPGGPAGEAMERV
jgi:nucleoside-diphosphate-sugar epimerase